MDYYAERIGIGKVVTNVETLKRQNAKVIKCQKSKHFLTMM